MEIFLPSVQSLFQAKNSSKSDKFLFLTTLETSWLYLNNEEEIVVDIKCSQES